MESDTFILEFNESSEDGGEVRRYSLIKKTGLSHFNTFQPKTESGHLVPGFSI